MFSFLVHPKRYISNSIVKSTLDELREPRPAIQPRQMWQNWFTYAAFLGILVFMTIPLWSYINAWQNKDIASFYLTIMGGLVFVFQIGLMIRTVSMALYIGGIDGYADQSTIDNRQILLSRWWAVCRAAALWMFVAILVKFLLALGISQYLHTTDAYDCMRNSFLTPLCHLSDLEIRFPRVSWMIAAGLSLFVFGLLETGISAATGLIFAALSKRQFSFGFGPAVAVRSLVVGAALGFWGLCPVLGNTRLFYSGSVTYRAREWYGILAQAQVGIITLADGGTIAAADLMRIESTTLHHVAVVGGMCLGLALSIGLLWGTLGAAVLVSRFGRAPAQQGLAFARHRQFAALPQDSAFEQPPADSMPAAIIEDLPVGQGN
jgi:hypothetical protein